MKVRFKFGVLSKLIYYIYVRLTGHYIESNNKYVFFNYLDRLILSRKKKQILEINNWFFVVKFKKIQIPQFFLLKLRQFNFYNTNFKVPNDAAAYLKYRFGNDWQIPNKSWYFWEDDHSLVIKKNE